MRNGSTYDIVVVGLGAMGSAAAFHLARRGLRVLGLDRFTPPHGFGSSHGRTRIIREAYFEHPLYVPLVRRAYELWAELEELSGRRILLRTGGLMIGPPDGALVEGARRSALEHGLAFRELSAAELVRRASGFRPAEDMVAIEEPRAGVLFPETAIEAHLALARGAGAELRVEEPVVEWSAAAGGVEVTTEQGRYTAARLVLAAGAWLPGLVAELGLPLTVNRQVQHWYRPDPPTHLFDPERFPIFICEYAPDAMWYGFPDTGDGVKVAVHHQGEPARPDTLRRTVTDEEAEPVAALLRRFMPAALGPRIESAVCMYTNTPDDHFIIDAHPEHPHVLLVSPCSGHGFKFSPVIGELVAELATGAAPRFDLAPFAVGRFGAVVASPRSRARPRTERGEQPRGCEPTGEPL
ncbi:MAG TPA: N-methyl-L-tryptophan oxidase [Longimicrobiales bacterium]